MVSVSKNLPKNDYDYFSEVLHSGEYFRTLDGTIYVFSSNDVTLTINQKVVESSYKILARPRTNEVILEYQDGYTNSFRLTNGLLEIGDRLSPLNYFYYSRRKN
jgi:hypothetical protein